MSNRRSPVASSAVSATEAYLRARAASSLVDFPSFTAWFAYGAPSPPSPELAVTDAMIERLARCLYNRDSEHFIRIGWDKDNEGLRGEYQREAHDLLRAALTIQEEEG